MAMWLLGCGASIGGVADAATRVPDATPPADAAREIQTTVFAVPDVVDTFVRLSDPTFNYGGSPRMCGDTTTDDRRILMRVDVSSLPAGAEITAATLRIWTGALTNDLSNQT